MLAGFYYTLFTQFEFKIHQCKDMQHKNHDLLVNCSLLIFVDTRSSEVLLIVDDTFNRRILVK